MIEFVSFVLLIGVVIQSSRRIACGSGANVRIDEKHGMPGD